MTLEVIKGGYDLSAEDQKLINRQRILTKEINDKFIQVPAVYVAAAVKRPIDDKWEAIKYRDTNLQDWVDDEALSQHNVGFHLQFGWTDVDIDTDSGDPEYARCIVHGLSACGVDTRLRFGRRSVGTPTHVMVQINDDEAVNFGELSRFTPDKVKIGESTFHVELRSTPMTNDTEMIRSAKQTVVPGSIHADKYDTAIYDPTVWYTMEGTPAGNVRDLKLVTTPRRASFNQLVRGIAFGTLAYVLRDHWVKGSRHATAVRVSGWLARLVAESNAMNNNAALAKDVYCPVDDPTIAESLLDFICGYFNDDEAALRKRAFRDACEKLDRNPDAKVPGWPSLSELIGAQAVAALRVVFHPGTDTSILTRMADRYLYDETDDTYVDRERHKNAVGIKYLHESAELERRHKGDTIAIEGQRKAAWRIFECSELRRRVDAVGFYPNLDPGGVFRLDYRNRIVPDEDGETHAVTAFNSWRGWPITPVPVVDETVMAECIAMLDQLLAYVTRDNTDQIEWIKQWIAWTFQNPADKQQIAWVCVGGQGVGKSFVGNRFLKAIMGHLWGTASPKVLEGDFVVAPFKDKMLVFIDEAKFHSESGTDEIKKFIRNVEVSGSEKYVDARTYQIYARLYFASNRFDMNIGQANVKDRALFYTKAYDKDHLNQTENEFRAWAETLKPFFDKFNKMLEDENVLRHFVHYFMHLPCNRHEVESIKHSSSGDQEIVRSNMGYHRRVAVALVENWRIGELDGDSLFPREALQRQISETVKEMGLRQVPSERVIKDLEESGVLIRTTSRHYKFGYKYATALSMYGQVIGVELEPQFEFTESDYGENDPGPTPKTWRGGTGFRQNF